MMIYIGSFLLSVAAACFATGKKAENNHKLMIFFSLISILIPSVLAGCRNTTIGTDTEFYLVQWYNIALYTDDFARYLSLDKEPLFLLLTFATAKIFGSINWLMFFIELIIMSNIYVGAYRFRKYISPPLVLALFFLLFYNDSYNLLRQYVALAIVFSGAIHIEDKNYSKFLIHVIIATLFHYTAIISLSLIIIKHFASSGRNKGRLAYDMLIVFAAAFLCVFAEMLISLAISFGFLDSHYSAYIERSSVSGNNVATVLYLFEVFCVLVLGFYKTNPKKNRFYVLLSITNLIVLQLGRVMFFGNRIGLYFSVVNLLVFAMIPQRFKPGISRTTVSIGLVAVCFVYWWYIYVRSGVSQTYPYVSDILGIG